MEAADQMNTVWAGCGFDLGVYCAGSKILQDMVPSSYCARVVGMLCEYTTG